MMQQDTINFIGYIAATCTTVSFLPQLIRVVRLRSARDISSWNVFHFLHGNCYVVDLWLAIAFQASCSG